MPAVFMNMFHVHLLLRKNREVEPKRVGLGWIQSAHRRRREATPQRSPPAFRRAQHCGTYRAAAPGPRAGTPVTRPQGEPHSADHLQTDTGRPATVLRRQINRSAINDDDRTLLGAIAASLRRPRRTAWLVTPNTPLKWHPSPHRPSLDTGHARTGTPTNLGPGPPTRPAPRHRESDLGVPPHPWRTARPRPPDRFIDHWEILKASGIDPAQKRSEVTWTQFLRSQAAVACDFLTVDTALPRRYYVPFFIHVEADPPSRPRHPIRRPHQRIQKRRLTATTQLRAPTGKSADWTTPCVLSGPH